LGKHHSHLEQARLNLGRIVRHLVAATILIVGQFQAVEGAGPGQGDAPMGWIKAIPAQGIAFIAGRGQEGVQPQSLVIAEVFVTQGQPVKALRQHLLHGVIHKVWIPMVLKTLGQRPGQTEGTVHLA
jgi:hypothetical protein